MPRTPKPFSLVLLATSAFLQAQSPAPTTQNPPPTSVPTIHANAQIVIVDVVVTDKNHKPVHNLKQSDFNVLEGSTPQTVSHFEEHIYPDPKAPQVVQRLPPLPPGVFTNFSPDPPSDAINVILLDSLNTPLINQANVRAQLKEYLNTAKPGIRTAIFGLTSRLILLQGFTSNPEILKSIVNKKNLNASSLLDDSIGTGAPETMSDQLSDIMGNDPISAQVLANLQQFEATNQAFQLQLRVGYTLDAMNLLARYLSGIPGRKNLIWFSGSFPLNVFPDSDLQQPFSVLANYDDELRETSRLLTAAQVAVYPVDARGLFTNPSWSASNSGTKSARNPQAMIKDQDKFFQQTAAENATMLKMAEQTGGHAFINTNGLSQAVAAAVDSGTNFYTLTYSPTNPAQDGKFRKIQVRLQQEGYNLAYRRGYYAIASNSVARDKPAPQSASTPAAKGAPAPLPPPDPMRAAMMRGGPDPTQIIFDARILPATTAAEDTLAPGSQANPNAKLSHGPYRRYQINVAADARSILFTKIDAGLYRSRLELRVYVYNQDGELITDSLGAEQYDLTLDQMKQIMASGFPLHQQISVPEKGSYFLRIGLHDLTGDRLGAIEVPIASIKTPPPPPAPVAPN